MRKNNKGFTIMELVVVLAAIAILAAVLIPTFATVISKSKESAAMQEARAEFELYLVENATALDGTEDYVIKSGTYYFTVTDLRFSTTALSTDPGSHETADLSDGLAGGNSSVLIYAKSTT